MPQSHQELFGYYMNNVLEREDDDDDGVFVASDVNSRHDPNSLSNKNNPTM